MRAPVAAVVACPGLVSYGFPMFFPWFSILVVVRTTRIVRFIRLGHGAKPPRRRLIFFVLPLQNHPKHVCLVRGRATRLVIHRVSRQTTHPLNGEPWECGCEEAPQHILTTARTARMPVGVFVYPMMLLHEHATIMFMRLEVLQIQGVPH